MYLLLTLLYYLGLGGSAAALLIAVVKSGATATPTHPHVSDPLEAAFLAGGPGRVADTVLTAMHADGRLAVAGPGVVGVRQALAYHPVEQAVLDVHAAAPSGALHWLRIGVMRSPAAQAVGDGLAQRGLLARPDERRPLRSWAGMQTALSFVSLWLAGVLTIVQFATLDGAGFALPFIVGVLPVIAAGLVVGLVCRALIGSRVTGAGKRALRRFRSTGNGANPVHLVACGGPRVAPDPVLRDQLTAAGRIRANSRTASAGTAGPVVFIGDTSVTWCGGGGDGSSCGGSSCGGSSCGGSSGGSGCGGGGGGGGCGGGGGGGGGGCGGGG
ncbi:TIGR04222 domain-containing membrane protein [Streptomyces sp. B-S-A8]|uniref:TIGR04222 domain-containing membrane protein n=1 Tax=Streptomyces solicavernae TaxID=3043614 RepID=A0ABT6RYF9_9ACTN|nr:TIGR04222 domain-containing membrane protein [Streptomyces sp. B-S-A8]MDI3389477.1 TIGR04222 domain-containing membrane protein [Streptomyces sp. B-S-A8]